MCITCSSYGYVATTRRVSRVMRAGGHYRRTWPRAASRRLIHYPLPIPKQPAFAAGQPAGCPVASQVCHEILSLPLHPAMHDEDVDAIADAVNAFDS